jgi:hypothetical protein
LVGGYNINEKNKKIGKAQIFQNLEYIFRAIFSMKLFRRYVASLIAKTQKAKIPFFESTSLYERKSFMVCKDFKK